MLDAVCDIYGMPPDVAEAQDEELLMAMLHARHAAEAVAAFNSKDATMTEAQSVVFNGLLDALDERDEAAGLDEEA